MIRDFTRNDRLSAEMHRLLGELFQQEVRDPRVRWISLQGVKISRDLAHATVYYTLMNQEHDDPEIKRLLNESLAGFLRSQLARLISARTVPQLRFVYDESVVRGERLRNLIDDLVAH